MYDPEYKELRYLALKWLLISTLAASLLLLL